MCVLLRPLFHRGCYWPLESFPNPPSCCLLVVFRKFWAFIIIINSVCLSYNAIYDCTTFRSNSPTSLMDLFFHLHINNFVTFLIITDHSQINNETFIKRYGSRWILNMALVICLVHFFSPSAILEMKQCILLELFLVWLF